MSNMRKMAVFSGTVNPALAEEIAEDLGIALGKIKIEKFANGEIYTRYLESIRGADVFLVQSVAGSHVNDALMELLIMVDAARRASAHSITAVISHYGYSRQDRKAASREPITAKLVANLLTQAGVDRTITIDLHQGQIQGFFDTPVNHLTALPILADYFKTKNLDMSQVNVVSPDVGRAAAAKKFSTLLGSGLAIMHKERAGHNLAGTVSLIGEVKDKICIVNDDMIDTAGTLVAAVDTLINEGAKKVYVCATHPVFSGPAYERLENSPIVEVVVTNSIPVPLDKQTGKIKVVSVAPMLSRAIKCVCAGDSLSDMFTLDFCM